MRRTTAFVSNPSLATATLRSPSATEGRTPADPCRSLGRLAALTVLAAGAALGGCAPVAVVGSTVIVNDDFAQNSQSVIVPYEVDYVWKSSRSTLSHMTSDLLDVDNDVRAIKTFVDGADVIVQVKTYAVGQTQIRVTAKRYLVYSDEVASNVLNRIKQDLR